MYIAKLAMTISDFCKYFIETLRDAPREETIDHDNVGCARRMGIIKGTKSVGEVARIFEI